MIRFVVILFFFLSYNSLAQDVHFSQFNETKALINPALVGYQDGDYKIQAQRRSQWGSVTVPFNTFSISLEVKNIIKKFSFGVQLLNDIAGDSHFKTNGVTLSLSHNTKVNSSNNISFGVLAGTYQRSIDYSTLVFNETENIPNNNIDFFDVAIGFVHEIELNISSTLISGVSLFHLNKPNQTLIGSDNIKLPINSKFHTSLIYYFNKKFQIKPTIYYSEQGVSRELIAGSFFNYVLNNSSPEMIVLRTGIFNRKNDAIITEFGIKIDNFDAMVSYDTNISSLNTASDYKGGFEFSIAYQWSVLKSVKSNDIKVCPKYL